MCIHTYNRSSGVSTPEVIGNKRNKSVHNTAAAAVGFLLPFFQASTSMMIPIADTLLLSIGLHITEITRLSKILEFAKVDTPRSVHRPVESPPQRNKYCP